MAFLPTVEKPMAPGHVSPKRIASQKRRNIRPNNDQEYRVH
jgi:hypothetical protein